MLSLSPPSQGSAGAGSGPAALSCPCGHPCLLRGWRWGPAPAPNLSPPLHSQTQFLEKGADSTLKEGGWRHRKLWSPLTSSKVGQVTLRWAQPGRAWGSVPSQPVMPPLSWEGGVLEAASPRPVVHPVWAPTHCLGPRLPSPVCCSPLPPSWPSSALAALGSTAQKGGQVGRQVAGAGMPGRPLTALQAGSRVVDRPPLVGSVWVGGFLGGRPQSPEVIPYLTRPSLFHCTLSSG